MIHTVLSVKELAILEEIIAHLGHVAYFEDIKKLLAKDYSSVEIKKRISLLSKRGWLVRIKRGVYAVADIESHNFANISPLQVSRVLVPDSYVSFEYALIHHGLFDQLPGRLTAVTPTRNKKFDFQGIDYRYVKIKSELYFGFETVTFDNLRANVAELEKAFLDYLYFRLDTYSVDLVLEKLKEGEGDLDFYKLQSFVEKYPFSVKRRLGFLLDLIGVPTDVLYREVKVKPGYGKLTNSSTRFNAKWRIYYEDRFTE